MLVDLRDMLLFSAGASGGALATWQLRGWLSRRGKKWSSERAFVRQVIVDLQESIVEARSLIADHKTRLHQVSELLGASPELTAASQAAVDGLIGENALLIDRLEDLEHALGSERDQIRWWLREQQPAPSVGDAAPPKPTPSERRLHELRDLAHNVSKIVEQQRAELTRGNAQIAGSRAEGPDNILTAIGSLLKAAADMQAEVVAADNRLREQTRLLEQQALSSSTDALTGLMNRGAFDEELARCDDLWRHQGQAYAVVLLDLDHFKSINDQYGHAAGDTVLKRTAAALTECMRPQEFVSRYGGEEFAVRCPGGDPQQLRALALRALETLRALQIVHENQRIHVTGSIGAAIAEEGESSANLVNRADEALYAAKRGGRDRAFFHNGVQVVAWGADALGFAPTAQAAAPTTVIEAPPTPAVSAVASGTVAERTAWRNARAATNALATRTVFFHGVNRCLEDRQNGGSGACVVLVHVEPQSLRKLSAEACDLLHVDVVRVLTEQTRTEDLRCDFDHGIYATLLHATSLSDAVATAARIRSAADQIRLPGKRGETIHVKTNVGVAEVADDTAVDLIGRATRALEQSTTSGPAVVNVSDAGGRIVAVPCGL